jgi:hypothetical protein
MKLPNWSQIWQLDGRIRILITSLRAVEAQWYSLPLT